MIVIWVGKVDQLSGNGRPLKEYRHKLWKVLYYENGKFGSKYIRGLDVIRYKLKRQKLRTYVCQVCGLKYRSNLNRCATCFDHHREKD